MKARKIIGQAPKGLPFCEGVMVGDTFYLSGSIGFDHETGRLVDGGIIVETKKAIDNLHETLKKVGMVLKDVVKVTVFLKTMDDFQAFNEIYASYFPDHPPAREAAAVAGLAFGACVELSFIAVKS